MLGIYQICRHQIYRIQCLTLSDYYEKMNNTQRQNWIILRLLMFGFYTTIRDQKAERCVYMPNDLGRKVLQRLGVRKTFDKSANPELSYPRGLCAG